MGRRDFLVLWIQALLLALFPWLRTDDGLTVAARAAEAMVPLDYAAFAAILKQRYSMDDVLRYFQATPGIASRT